MSFLLDPDICSAHLKQRPALTTAILQHAGRLNISTITLGELSTWARAQCSCRRLQSLRDFLLGVSVLSVDEQVAENSAKCELLSLMPVNLLRTWIC